MRLDDMLKDISSITNQVVKSNCFDGQNTLLDGILLIQTKVNEVIQAINEGIIKGDKGDTPNVQVGNTQTLEPGSNASVTQTGDILNPIFNFAIPKGLKGDKGDTGKASESIQDDIISLDTCYSSEKTVSLFNDLKNIQGVKYSNDVGYQVCKGTHNGVVKDIKVYGKSLVNVGGSNFTWGKNYANLIIKKELIKPNTKYVFKLEGDLSNLSKIYCGSSDDLEILIPVKYNTTQMNFTSPNINFTKEIKFICYNNGTEFTESQVKTWKLTIVECDSLDEIPQYFEGIASVGNGNEIEVLSSNSNIAYNMKNVKSTDGTTVALDSIAFDSVLIKEGSQYTVKSSVSGTLYYKGTYCTGLNENIEKTFTLPSPTRPNDKFPFSIYKSGGDISINENTYIMLSLGDKLSSEKYNKQDKKTILFKDTDNTWKPLTNLRGIDENNCDIIDSAKNKLCVNMVPISLNGLQTINSVTVRGNTVEVSMDIRTYGVKPNTGYAIDWICDKLPSLQGSDDVPHIRTDGSIPNANLKLYLPKSYGTTKEQITLSLSTTPITFIGTLANTVEYEINPIFPNSYDNETMILFDTGVIPPKNEFYIDSNLGSLQLETLDRLSRIEDYVYQSNVAILRGDFRSLAEIYYPNDFIKEEELQNE